MNPRRSQRSIGNRLALWFAAALLLSLALAGAVHPIHEDSGVGRACPACQLHHQAAIAPEPSDLAAPVVEVVKSPSLPGSRPLSRTEEAPSPRGPPFCI
jgi:hypothetical protein